MTIAVDLGCKATKQTNKQNHFKLSYKGWGGGLIIKYVLQAKSKTYSKTCLKGPLKNRKNGDLNDKW